jgi:hypothetical protein
MGRYTRLCLNGGGVRGMLQVGGIDAYLGIVGESYPYKVFTEGVHGISIGAIICTFIAFGFSIKEIRDIFHDFDVTDIISPPRLQNILDYYGNKGLDTGERIHDRLREVFMKKGIVFDDLTIGDALIPLYIVGSDLSRSKYVVFYEKIKVWDAIRASISLPMVFTPHIIKGRVFVDGAISCTHILHTVPLSERTKALALLPSNIRVDQVEKLNGFAFMNHVAGVRTNDITRTFKGKYPNNLCVMVENTTNMMDVDADKEYLFQTGRNLALSFFSESCDEEGSVRSNVCRS